jgi:LysM repeat protein
VDIKRILSIIDGEKQSPQALTEGRNMAKDMVMQHYNKYSSSVPSKKTSNINEYFKVVDEEMLKIIKEDQEAKKVQVKKIVDRVLERLDENKKVAATKPRNFVAKNQQISGAGAHKDKKKAEKQGDVKHKKDQIPVEVSEQGVAEGHRAARRPFAEQDLSETSDYARRREREEKIISGQKPARKKAPAQTSDYARRREQQKKQGVAEASPDWRSKMGFDMDDPSGDPLDDPEDRGLHRPETFVTSQGNRYTYILGGDLYDPSPTGDEMSAQIRFKGIDHVHPIQRIHLQYDPNMQAFDPEESRADDPILDIWLKQQRPFPSDEDSLNDFVDRAVVHVFRPPNLSEAEYQGVAEGSLEEYGDTPKGQKMLGKVQARAATRIMKNWNSDDRDYAANKKNRDNAERAYARIVGKKDYSKGVAEGKDISDMEMHRLNVERFRKDLGLPDIDKPKSSRETDMDIHRKNVERFRKDLDLDKKKGVAEKAVSKAQQRFMGMVHAAKKGEKPASAAVAKVAKGMSAKAAKDYAKTKHKGLPEKKNKKTDEGQGAGGKKESDFLARVATYAASQSLNDVDPKMFLRAAELFSKGKIDLGFKVIDRLDDHVQDDFFMMLTMAQNKTMKLPRLPKNSFENESQGISKKKETEFHAKLDTLVHNTFGKRKGENEGLEDPKDNPCWKGYKPVGTKKKNGRTVPNCVPKESIEVGSTVKVYSNVLKKPVYGTVMELNENRAYVNYADTKIIMGHSLNKIELIEAAAAAQAPGALQAAKTVGRGALSTVGRALPGVGLVAGGYDAYQRAKQGDWGGAALSGAAGLAGLVPGLGTAAATGLIGAQIGRDKARTGSYFPGYDEIGATANPQTAAQTAPKEYDIKSGDTLTKIAKANNTTVDAIMKANPQITDPNKISAGTKLNLPGGAAPGANIPNPKPAAQPQAAAQTPVAAPGANIPNPKPAAAPKTTTTNSWSGTLIANEPVVPGQPLSQKQMAVMQMAIDSGNQYSPEIMAQYNKQKGSMQ